MASAAPCLARVWKQLSRASNSNYKIRKACFTSDEGNTVAGSGVAQDEAPPTTPISSPALALRGTTKVLEDKVKIPTRNG